MEPLYDRNFTQCCNNIYYRQSNAQWKNFSSYNNHNCYKTRTSPGEPGISKGIVKSLKDKIISLQNESVHFKTAQKPTKKKQKDYYCLMLRKINALDKKLQNLENLFTSHVIKHVSEEVFSGRNCDYQACYDTIRSLTDLANKLKEDVVCKSNDIHYNLRLHNRIQVLESELRDLFLYLEQFQNSEEETYMPTQTQPNVQKYHQYRNSSNISLNGHGGIQPSKDKFRHISEENKFIRMQNPQNRNTHIHNNIESLPNTYKNNNFIYRGKNTNNLSPKCQCYRCNKRWSGLEDETDKPLIKNVSIKEFHYQQSIPSPRISVCSCSSCEMAKKRYNTRNKQLNNNHDAPCPCNNDITNSRTANSQFKTHSMTFVIKRSKNNYETYNANSGNRNDYQRNTKNGYNGKGNNRVSFDEEKRIPYPQPKSKRKHKKKQSKDFKKGLAGEEENFLLESPSSSPQKHLNGGENVNEIFINNEGNYIINSKKHNLNKHENNNNENMVKNIIYYEVSPVNVNNKYRPKLVENHNKGNREFPDDKTNKNKKGKNKEFSKRTKQKGEEKYHVNSLISFHHSLNNDLLPNSNLRKETKYSKPNHDEDDSSDLSSSRSEERVKKEVHYSPFKRNHKSNLPYRTSAQTQNKNKTATKKYIHVQIYRDKDSDEYFERPYRKSRVGNKFKQDPSQPHTISNKRFQPSQIEQHRKNVLKYSKNRGISVFSNQNGKRTIMSNRQLNKFKIDRPDVFESESYETIEENKYSSDTSSSQNKICFCNDPECKTNCKELIISSRNNNLSSSSEDSDIRRMIDSLKNLETDICDECIIKEKIIKVLPHQLCGMKGIGKRKVIVRQEIIRCQTCMNKMGEKVSEVDNKNSINDNKVSVESIKQEKDGEAPQYLVPEKYDENIYNFNANHNEMFQNTQNRTNRINSKGLITREEIWNEGKNNNIIPTYIAKLEQDNLFHQSHFNNKTNESLDLLPFGNTININIDRGSYLADIPSNKPSNIKKICSKSTMLTVPNTKTLGMQMNEEDVLINSYSSKNNTEFRDKANSNESTLLSLTNMNDQNASKSMEGKTTESSTKVNSDSQIVSKMILSNDTNWNTIDVEKKSSNEKQIGKILKVLDKINDRESNENNQSSLVDTVIEHNKTCQDTTVLLVSNEHNLEPTFIHQNHREEISTPVENFCSPITLKKDLIKNFKLNTLNTSKSNDFKEVKVITESSSKVIPFKKIENPPQQDMKHILRNRDSDYKSHYRVGYKMAINKRNIAKRKFKNVERTKDVDSDSNFITGSGLFKNSRTAIRHCNICPKHHFVGREPALFNPGRKVRRIFRHRHAFPRTSSKNVSSFNASDNLHSFTSDTRSKDDLQNEYHVNLNPNITSESSFCTLNWKKIATKLKEDQNYVS